MKFSHQDGNSDVDVNLQGISIYKYKVSVKTRIVYDFYIEGFLFYYCGFTMLPRLVWP